MGKHFNKVMNKMCSYVGVKFKDINPKKENWFLEYSWTDEQEADFVKWFVDYLYSSSEARREIMTYPIKDKKMIIRMVLMFILNYGWRLEDGKKKD